MRGVQIAAIAAGVALAGGGAWMFRYEPHAPTLADHTDYDDQFVRLWDRIDRRDCYQFRPDVSAIKDIACSPIELQTLVARQQAVNEADWKRMAAISGIRHGDGADFVQRAQSAGFSPAEVEDWISGVRRKFAAAGIPTAIADEYFGGSAGKEMLPYTVAPPPPAPPPPPPPPPTTLAPAVAVPPEPKPAVDAMKVISQAAASATAVAPQQP